MAKKNMQAVFSAAAGRHGDIELWIDHPHTEYCFQKGVCVEANEDYLIMGPPDDAPGRIGIPYDAIRWFRIMDEQ